MPALVSILLRILRMVLRTVVMNRVRARRAPTPQPVRAVVKIEGAEYLRSAVQSHASHPFVQAFRAALTEDERAASLGGPGAPVGESGELSEEMLAGLAVVTRAAQDAAQRGDFAGMREALHIGLKTLTKLQR